MYDGMIAAMEENPLLEPEAVAGYRAYLKHLRELLPKLGRVAAASFDVGTDGVRFAGSYLAPDPQGLFTALRGLFGDRALEAMGVDPLQARDRVASMSDHEVQQLATDIRQAPAGADGGTLLAAIVIVAAIWYFVFRR